MNVETLRTLGSGNLGISTVFKQQLHITEGNCFCTITINTEKKELYIWFHVKNLKNSDVNPFNGKSVYIPRYLINELNWTNEYYIQTILDLKNNCIICKNTEIKRKNMRINELTQRDFYILEQRRKGKTYKEIAIELNISISRVTYLKRQAYYILRKIQEGKYDFMLPEGFVFPDDLI